MNVTIDIIGEAWLKWELLMLSCFAALYPIQVSGWVWVYDSTEDFDGNGQ